MNTQHNSKADLIARFRHFNRFYTNTLGLLRRRLLESRLGLAEARTLFEICKAPGCSAVTLSGMLCMDRSQLSRIITKLHTSGLIERDSKPSGRKAVPLHPTAKGINVLNAVDTAATAHAAALLRHLDDAAAERLSAALNEVTNLLSPPTSPEQSVTIRPAQSGDMAWIIDRHAALYEREHGFDADFERYVLLGLAAYVQLTDPHRSGLFIAEEAGHRLGSVGIVETEANMAQLRWLLVTPEARGKGVGRALVQQACTFAAEHKYARMFLWTLACLTPARDLYTSFGFQLMETKEGCMGGQAMIEERWELQLN